MKRTTIKVPESAVRSAEEILKGMHLSHDGKIVWATCWNCGGTGAYPSSMTPPGLCRLYCWATPTNDPFNPHKPKAAGDPTFGKLAYSTDKWVKKQQASDRSNYRAQVRMEQQEKERQARLAGGIDPRIEALAKTFSIDPKGSRENLPAYWESGHTQVSDNYLKALSLIQQWVNKGELSAAQWELVRTLPTYETERLARIDAKNAEKAKSQWLGSVGDRLEVSGTIVGVFSFEKRPFRHSYATRNATYTAYVVKMKDAHSNVVSWFADVSPVQLDADGRITENKTVIVKGTVKKHEEYKGEKQTMLQRVKVQ